MRFPFSHRALFPAAREKRPKGITLQVNVSTDPERSVDITNGDKIIVDYTYSVNWREGSTPYERRMEKYSRYSFLPQHLEVGFLYCLGCNIQHT